MRRSAAIATLELAATLWAGALILDSYPLDAVPALLTGVGVLVMSTVATVGMIVVGGRWARWLGLAALGFMIILAIIRPIDLLWILAVTSTVLAVMALLSPPVTTSIRKLPSASGPPPRAVAPALLLLAAPTALGLLGNESSEWVLLVVGMTAPTAAFLYSRVIPGGLVAIRVLWPALALALCPLLGWWAGSAAAGLALAVLALSWHRSVKASYHPPYEPGTTYRIPPELAPREVLDAAELDDRGRRK